MKRNNLKYIAIALLGAICLTSCYDDKSTYATNLIDEVSIDTTGISSTLYVGYQEMLDLVPTISVKTKSVEDNLDYEWALTELPKDSNTDYEIISTEKELHHAISRPISATPYTLKLTVTDTENDNLQYLCTWQIYVQSSFVDGLLISDTKDGATSDFTFIKNKSLTLNYTKDEKIYRNILENANGVPYNGLMTSLTYEVQGYTTMVSTHLNQVWAIADNGYCTRFNCEDFSQNGSSDSESLITYKPAGFKFLKFVKGYQLFFAYTSSGFYSFNVISVNSFGWYDAGAKGYTVDNNVIAANSSSSINNNHTVWLDKAKGQFISYSGSGSGVPCTSYVANSVFDPNDMFNKSAIAAGIAEDASIATFLLKDDQTGEYGIYTLSQYVEEQGYWDDDWINYTQTSPEVPASAKNKYIIPESGKTLLNKAVSIFFAQKESVLYIATEDGIYAITYGSGENAIVSTVAKFTPTNGEKITKAKLYQQGQYTNDIGTMTGMPAFITPLPWNNKAIIVVTQKSDSEGKVYVMPITQAGIGTLDPSKALSYSGFGKILDVTTIGY
nr:PKD-like family lipoprotein [uncultured Bacteroides sp.]